MNSAGKSVPQRFGGDERVRQSNRPLGHDPKLWRLVHHRSQAADLGFQETNSPSISAPRRANNSRTAGGKNLLSLPELMSKKTWPRGLNCRLNKSSRKKFHSLVPQATDLSALRWNAVEKAVIKSNFRPKSGSGSKAWMRQTFRSTPKRSTSSLQTGWWPTSTPMPEWPSCLAMNKKKPPPQPRSRICLGLDRSRPNRRMRGMFRLSQRSASAYFAYWLVEEA